MYGVSGVSRRLTTLKNSFSFLFICTSERYEEEVKCNTLVMTKITLFNF